MNLEYTNSLIKFQNQYKQTQHKYNLLQQKYDILQTAMDSNLFKYKQLESDYKISNESYTKYYASMQNKSRNKIKNITN